MSIKSYKPKTATLRYQTVQERKDLAKDPGPKSLRHHQAYRAGRSDSGRISMRHRGGRHKRLYRVIDFKRRIDGVEGVVKSVHYDPNRSANIALISYPTGRYDFILAPEGIKSGDKVVSSPQAPIRMGNALPLENIPPGTNVHNIEMRPGRGGQIARSAGAYATVMGLDGKYALLKMPSGETRKILAASYGTIGVVGNSEHNLITYGKAGRKRWLGRRPRVRGVVMNPVDHPLGGGEGKSSGGRHPVSKWGQPAKGYRTRKKSKLSDSFIITRRKGRN